MALDTFDTTRFATTVAGKNKILNGGFDIWQRGTTFQLGSGFPMCADRWNIGAAGGWLSRQTVTPGTFPVETPYYARWNITTNSQYYELNVYIEDVKTLAGQTATFSCWARRNSGTQTLAVRITQNFGTGGSPSSDVITYPDTNSSGNTFSTSWQKYTWTFQVPSIAGKTLGTGNNHYIRVGFQCEASAIGSFDFAQAQLEAGPVATEFSRAEGHILFEQMACMRYYQRFQVEHYSDTNGIVGVGLNTSTTNAAISIPLMVPMKTIPTVTTSGNGSFSMLNGTYGSMALASYSSNINAVLNVSISGGTAGVHNVLYVTDRNTFVELTAEF